ncbi:MAG: hypothetical protein JNJ54_03680 [Myxococcaceae bacterium]|nr:hypothetical protein [Myxococcaceae bacterium]
MLAVALALALAQPSIAPPPLPLPSPSGFQVVPDDGLITRILALDRQLRAPAPTWAAPVAGAGLGLGALTFSLAAVGLMNRPTVSATLFLVLGVLLGSLTTIGGTVAGVVGYGEAVRRAELDDRRQRLVDELERRAGVRPTD